MPERIDRRRRAFLLPGSRDLPPAVRPPWSSETNLARHCTGCGRCAEACPQGIIHLEDGLPRVDLAHDECTFCGACAEACPEAVFDTTRRDAFSHRVRVGDECLAVRGVLCQSCGDACPDVAIRFRPRLRAAPIPEIDESRCSGCGACISACPAGAVQPHFSGAEAGHA